MVASVTSTSFKVSGSEVYSLQCTVPAATVTFACVQAEVSVFSPLLISVNAGVDVYA